MVMIVFEGTRRALLAPQSPDVRGRWTEAGTALMFDGIAARAPS
jgi:hypothetical protein